MSSFIKGTKDRRLTKDNIEEVLNNEKYINNGNGYNEIKEYIVMRLSSTAIKKLCKNNMNRHTFERRIAIVKEIIGEDSHG